MYGKDSNTSNKWLIGTFVGYFIDLAIIETLIMVCSASDNVSGTGSCCKKRGLWFDYDTYEKFYHKKLK